MEKASAMDQETTKNSDRRANDRVEAELHLEIPLADNSGFRQVRTKNISGTGLAFRVQGPIKLPATGKVQLTLPDGQSLMLNAEIRHAKRIVETGEIEVGAQLKSVPPHVAQALQDAIYT